MTPTTREGPDGLIDRARRQATGTVVSVHYARASNLDVDGKYGVLCEPHGEVTGTDNRRDAFDLARSADEWCPACAGDLDEKVMGVEDGGPSDDRQKMVRVLNTMANVDDDVRTALRRLDVERDPEGAKDALKRALSRMSEAHANISG